MPAEDGLRPNEDERATPFGPDLGEPDPQKPVGGPKRDARPGTLALEDQELMAESEHLGLECGTAAEQRSERCENSQKSRDHRSGSLAQLWEILNDPGPDRVLGRHTDGVKFRNDSLDGVGGRQIVCEDPSGNVIELTQPA